MFVLPATNANISGRQNIHLGKQSQEKSHEAASHEDLRVKG